MANTCTLFILFLNIKKPNIAFGFFILNETLCRLGILPSMVTLHDVSYARFTINSLDYQQDGGKYFSSIVELVHTQVNGASAVVALGVNT